MNAIYEYRLQNATNALKVWNVTDPINPTIMNTSVASSVLTFKVFGDVNNQFVAFDGNSFYTPSFVGVVQNQNLHALQNVDYLIITHPNFQSQAERLRNIHANIDDLNIEIVSFRVVQWTWQVSVISSGCCIIEV